MKSTLMKIQFLNIMEINCEKVISMKDPQKYEAIKFLEGKRVYLRPIENEDLDLFYAKALWDKEVRRLTGTQTVFSRLGVQK